MVAVVVVAAHQPTWRNNMVGLNHADVSRTQHSPCISII